MAVIQKQDKSDKPHFVSYRKFIRHLIRNIAIGLVISGLSLYAGMAGYHYIEKLSWVDAYENAAMILSGMGPVNNPTTTLGKIFAGTYAIFSGLIFIVIIGVLFAPIYIRFFKKYLLETNEEPKSDKSKATASKTNGQDSSVAK